MGLYDEIDRITEKQINKTETGDNRILGVVLGLVAKNYDKNMPGRVCVTVPVRDSNANELKWARVSMPSSGSKWGHYFLPEVGDQVLLAFEQGNIERPYVIGCIPKDSNRFLSGAVDQDNQYKEIVTKYGNTIIFEDNKEGEGEKDKISIMTAKQSHQVILDNENHKIILSDKDKKNKIEMLTESGNINIVCEKKVTIKVGDSIEITLNGSSGAVSVECNKLEVKASQSLNVKTDGMAKLSGANTIIEASSTFKASSSGVVIVEGAPIKIG